MSGIYALVVGGVVRYIGQAKSITKRYGQHCSIAQNRGGTKKNVWLYGLLLSGVKPDLVVLEQTSNLDDREIFWIDYYRKLGQAEMNTMDGGRSFAYAEKSKAKNPWGKRWSPVRRRLNAMQDVLQYYRRVGDLSGIARAEGRLRRVNEAVKRVGLKRMNMMLWRVHGETK